ILLFDPLPSINKAYSMVLSAERQRSVTNSFDNIEKMAMTAKYEGYGRGQVGQNRSFGGRGGNWQSGRGRGGTRLSKEERAKLLCDKCGMYGHTIATCFKIHGVPEWYKDLKVQQAKSYANSAETYEDEEQWGVKAPERKSSADSELSLVVKQLQEITQYIKGKENLDGQVDYAQMANIRHQREDDGVHFALTIAENLSSGVWIIDTGASRHTCGDLNIMSNISVLKEPVSVCLPDGSHKGVNIGGTVAVTNTLTLKGVLY
ncbi:Unknown protein, partial [Striga hermonthica]